MMTFRRVAVVGSRDFKNYAQLNLELKKYISYEDELVSGGAMGADSMAQRWAKENGHTIHVHYPRWERGKSAGFLRNKRIVENSDLVLAFYAKGRFQQGGTSNTIKWAQDLGVPYHEFEEYE
jgi:hypothetical protein